MKLGKKCISLILALVMVLGLTVLTSCGKKDDASGGSPEPDGQPSGYQTDNSSPVGGFDQTTQPPTPPATTTPDATTPEISATPDIPNVDTEYGGIPMNNVFNFLGQVYNKDPDSRKSIMGFADLKKFSAEYPTARDEGYDERELWLDQVLLAANADDYKNATDEEMEDASNMIVVIAVASSEYVPNAMTLKDFLGDNGLKVYERWTDKLKQDPENKPPVFEAAGADPEDYVNNDPESPEWAVKPDNIGNPGSQTPEVTQAPEAQTPGATQVPDDTQAPVADDIIKNTTYRLVEARDGYSVQVEVSAPDLAGTTKTPSVLLILFGDDGTVLDYEHNC